MCFHILQDPYFPFHLLFNRNILVFLMSNESEKRGGFHKYFYMRISCRRQVVEDNCSPRSKQRRGATLSSCAGCLLARNPTQRPSESFGS